MQQTSFFISSLLCISRFFFFVVKNYQGNILYDFNLFEAVVIQYSFID